MPLHDWDRVEPTYFHDLHVGWLGALRSALNNGVLPPDFYAMAEQTTAAIVPDVLALGRRGRGGQPPRPTGRTVLAVADRPPRVLFADNGLKAKSSKPAQRRVAIHHASRDQLVAVIEIVSHGNKSSGREFRQFVNKATDLLDQGIHLLVVDVHPPTPRDPDGLHAAIWKSLVKRTFSPPAGKPLTLASYAALGAGEFTAYVQPVAVGDKLPEMPLFLTPDVYVNVPLEGTYQEAWRGFGKPIRGLIEGTSNR
jgi:hypothetical protein